MIRQLRRPVALVALLTLAMFYMGSVQAPVCPPAGEAVAVDHSEHGMPSPADAAPLPDMPMPDCPSGMMGASAACMLLLVPAQSVALLQPSVDDVVMAGIGSTLPDLLFISSPFRPPRA